MNILSGTYECKSDAKGRIVLSVGLKKQLEPVLNQGFVLKRSMFQPCLELYPKLEWEKFMTQMMKLNRFVKKNNDFIRAFTAGSKEVDIDANGRLLLAKDLLSYSGIVKDVVLASSITYIEIWDKEAYESAIDVEMDGFDDLAEQVMGGLSF